MWGGVGVLYQGAFDLVGEWVLSCGFQRGTLGRIVLGSRCFTCLAVPSALFTLTLPNYPGGYTVWYPQAHKLTEESVIH